MHSLLDLPQEIRVGLPSYIDIRSVTKYKECCTETKRNASKTYTKYTKMRNDRVDAAEMHLTRAASRRAFVGSPLPYVKLLMKLATARHAVMEELVNERIFARIPDRFVRDKADMTAEYDRLMEWCAPTTPESRALHSQHNNELRVHTEGLM